jgi:hypothetical protein
MTDAPFTETDRKTLEKMLVSEDEAAAIDAALRHITLLEVVAEANIVALRQENDRLLRRVECDGWRIEDLKVEIDRLTKVAVTPCACRENEGCSECRRVENPPHGPVSERFMRQHYGAKR